MVYGQIARAAFEGIRAISRYSGPKVVRAFTKYDKKIFRNLYGQSGGRGVRHGRDIGAAVGGLLALGPGDDLDNGSRVQPKYSSRSKPKARRGRGYSNRYGHPKYCSCNRIRR